MRPGKTVIVLAAACALSATVAACGSSDKADSSAAASSASQGAGASDAPLADLLPDDVRSKGTLTIGAFLQQPPDVFLDEDGKTVIGFEAELSKAIGDKLGVDVEYKDMQFDALITSLQAERIDLTMSAMNDKKEREEKIDFVDYFQSGISLMVAKGNPEKVMSPEDICGHSVGVVNGTTQSDFAAEQDANCRSAGKPGVEIVSTTSDSQNQLSLKTGRIDLIVNDLPTAAYLARTADDGNAYEVVPGDPINPGPFGIGVNKKDTQLRDAVQQALQAVIDDGQYEEILTKWGVEDGALPTATVNAAPADS